MITTLIWILLAQDSPAALLDRLRSDDVRDRDAASRQLESLGLESIERLQAQAGEDLEVRARLRDLVSTLRKRAEMAKIFGPTKRVTATFRQRKLGEVLQELKKALDEPLAGDRLNEASLVDLDLRGATLWETYEALSRAAKVHVQVDQKVTKVLPGPPALLPERLVEQFRLSVLEIQRLELREPGRSAQVGLVTLSASYQRNLSPVQDGIQEALLIDSAVDAAGQDQRIPRIDWEGVRSYRAPPYTFISAVLVRSDKGPLAIEGRTQIRFEVKHVTLSIPLEEGKRKIRAGDYTLDVDELVKTPTGLSMTIRAEGDQGSPSQRLKEDSVVLVDKEGKSHPASSPFGSESGTLISRTLVFPAGIETPDHLSFDWITEFHLVEIPFRFEGIQIP
ncbi:MAG TPA: hypothetical protein VKW04_05650 [Planctomycetota bacterium]|nr:hypothetical protein [Planctomycetota bacterium]